MKKCDILFSLLHDKIDRAVLAANPKLRAVASMSITPDNIDVAEASKRGIAVTVVPPIVAESVADLHFGLMIAVARRMVEGDRSVRASRFPGSQSNHLAGSFVHGKTIGLVAVGRIGQATARRARGFGMRIIYWGPRRKPELERELQMEYMPLDQLLAESDFVSLHPPLNAETRHMISDRRIRADEADRLHHQYRARRHHRRSGAGARAEEETHRRRRARRVRERAEGSAGPAEG